MQGKAFFSTFVLATATLCVSVHTLAATKAGYTLNQAIHRAITTHPDIGQLQAQREGARYGAIQAKQEFLPSVDLHLATGWERSDNPTTRGLTGESTHRSLKPVEEKVMITQPIFSGFSSINHVKQENAVLRKANAQLYDHQEKIALQSTKAFLDVMRMRELNVLAQRNVNQHKRILKKTKAHYKGGAGRKTDYDLSLGRLALAKARLARTKGLLWSANALYLNTVGINPPSNMLLPSVSAKQISTSLSKIIDVVKTNNPELLAAYYRIQSDKSAVAVARSEFSPKINLELSGSNNNDIDGIPGSMNDGRNKDLRAIFSMDYNLFQGGRSYTHLQQAKQHHIASQKYYYSTERNLIEKTTQDWANYQAALTRLTSLRSHVESTKLVLDGYRQQFELGRRSILNVLDMENELFNSRSELINGEFDVKRQRYQLLADMGRLQQSI